MGLLKIGGPYLESLMGTIKVAILEKDGEEYELPVEMDLSEALSFIELLVEKTNIIYLGNGNVDYVEYFKSLTDTTANRIAKVLFTYNSDLTPNTEELTYFGSNGVDVVKTFLWTFTYNSGNLISYKREIS